MQGRSRFCWVRACMLALYSIFLALYTHTARGKFNNNFFRSRTSILQHCPITFACRLLLAELSFMVSSCGSVALLLLCVFFRKSFPRPHCVHVLARTLLNGMYGDNLFTFKPQVSSENASFNIIALTVRCVLCVGSSSISSEIHRHVWAQQVCKHPKIVPRKSNLRRFEKAQNPEEKPRNRLKKSFAAIYKRLKKAQKDLLFVFNFTNSTVVKFPPCSWDQSASWSSLLNLNSSRYFWHFSHSCWAFGAVESEKTKNYQIAHSSAHFSSISF